MADYLWSERSPLSQALVPGHKGAKTGEPGVTLTEFRGLSLVQIMARRGQWPAVAKAAKKQFGTTAPDKPYAVFGKAATLVWSGPDQFLALTAGHGLASPLQPLEKAFSGIASLTDQSDGRVLIGLSGPRVRDAVAKLSSLDLHDTAFPVGAAAATSIDHTNASIWRGPDGHGGNPAYYLLVFTSFADSLWRSIADAAAEYGVESGIAPAF